MDKFTTLTGVAVPINMTHVDTDRIIPKNYLKTIKRTGLGKALFAEMRYDAAGREDPEFILNKAPFRKASIIVAGENFGCGSSREHAPWALLDFGIRCVIAPSFADIFFNNTFKNGILPITLPEARVTEMTIDLPAQTVLGPDRKVDKFDIDPFRKHCLVNGLDDVGLTLQQEGAIKAFEVRSSAEHPWL